MTTLQFISDLHIEYTHDEIPDPNDYVVPVADTLILAGDIGSLYKLKQLKGFLSRLASLFQAIIYVPGNHEYYSLSEYKRVSLPSLEKRLERLSVEIPNLHILNRSSARIGNICIVGCTLWSKLKCQVPRFIVRIQDMDTAEYCRRHTKDLLYIKNMAEYCRQHNYRMVVVTHHPPSLKCLEGVKKKKRFISLYATNLDKMLSEKNMELWICGHTHKNNDFITSKGCRVVTNQKGKPKDRIKDYRRDFVVTL